MKKIRIDENMVTLLSAAKKNVEKYILLLKVEYGFQLTKAQLAVVLGISCQTIDRRIKEGMNIPNYHRSSNGKNASYIFPIVEVAEYLSNTIKVV